jgi:DNA-binding NtrC family response regulator
MSVLIVESNAGLGGLWQDHMRRMGLSVALVADAEAAVAIVDGAAPPDVLIVDLDLPAGQALALADYAGFRRPGLRVIFVTAGRFFSDGSVFCLNGNAVAHLPVTIAPQDLSTIADYHHALAATRQRLM